MSIRAQKIFSWSALMLIAIVPLLMLVFMALPMDHGMAGVGCPFMQGETSLCPMTTLDHLNSWEAAFTAFVIQLVPFAVPVLALAWFWLTVPKSEPPPRYRRRFYPVPPLLQELLSSGLLNPRVS